jgi:monoterpene epsilon-lactone hydrolase
MPSPQGEQLRAYMKGVMSPALQSQISLETRRAQLEAIGTRTPLPSDVQVEEVIVDHLTGDWIHTPEALGDRVVLYLHGGGFVMGSSTAYRFFASALSRITQSRVFVLNYRLAPEHPFPAAFEDSTAAYRWLLSAAVKPGHVILMGDSAGGTLALSNLIASRDAGVPLPAGAVLISPLLDMTMSGASYTSNAELDIMENRDLVLEMRHMYLGERDPRSPEVSPLFADLHGLPPLLVHVGSDELLLDDSKQVVERVHQAGGSAQLHIGDGMWHVWHTVAVRQEFPEGKLALDQIHNFVQQHISGS